jgi:hypothetical protein
MNFDLPTHATADETCAWLSEQTGREWTLARLLECHLQPWFWLDYTDATAALFGGRTEGYLAPMCFSGDLARLQAHRADALVTVTRSRESETLVRFTPGIAVDVSELRFLREDVKALARDLSAATPLPDKSHGTQPKLNEADKAEIVRLYNRGRGVSVNKLAKQFCVARLTLDKALKQAGVKN